MIRITRGVKDEPRLLFNSREFLVFLPTILVLYFLLNQRWQNRLLLCASLFFYGAWDARFLWLLFATMVVDFYVASYLEKLAIEGAPTHIRKRVVAISMAANLVCLGFFKYFNFFVDSLHELLSSLGLNVPERTLDIILPIGISFYTFQSMSYTIDVYRRELKPAKSFLDFALFVSFFPHLVAGPIMRAVDLLPQIIRPRVTTKEQVRDGIHLIVWGFWKKVFVADNLAPIVNSIFGAKDPTGFETLIAVYAFAWQIYCDFSGYTDIARGVSKLMGFELILNFNLPYFAKNPQDFWTRWHISLSSWLRNYLYIPLGGNRGTESQLFRNLMLTMILGGLWHGAAWNFVLWGFYQGFLLVLHRKAKPLLDTILPSDANTFSVFIRCIVMFHLTCYGWLLFRARDFGQIKQMTLALATHFGSIDPQLATKVAAFVMPLFLIQLGQYAFKKLDFLNFSWARLEVRTAFYSALIYLAAFRAPAPQSFIYFQF
jgi:alginate O-acetyltransferase complex protein AlgI